MSSYCSSRQAQVPAAVELPPDSKLVLFVATLQAFTVQISLSKQVKAKRTLQCSNPCQLTGFCIISRDVQLSFNSEKYCFVCFFNQFDSFSLVCICGMFPFSRHKIEKQQLVKFHSFLLKFKVSRCKITA